MASLAMAGCDLSVTNPGPVQDPNLDDPAAFEGLVNGAMRNVLGGWSMFAHQSGTVVREIQPSGEAGAGGIFREIELGYVDPIETQRHVSGGYIASQKGRWIAEEAIARIKRVLGPSADSNTQLGRAYLWAGIANRVLGEHVCTAVFDGGAAEPYLSHFSRAVAHFDNAERVATAARDETTRMAAIALRAAANVYLGNWTAAVTDAAKIPITYTYAATFPNRGTSDLESGERWRLNSALVSGGVSLWYTFSEKYFTETGDPRVAWGQDPRQPLGRSVRAAWGVAVPLMYPLKFYSPRAANERTVFAPNSNAIHGIPINLATGREMQLIRAEAALIQNNQAMAMTLINGVRARYNNYFTGQPLAPAVAANINDAWTVLKRERFAELLMEGRRFGDRKRWAVNKTPGVLDPMEYIPDNHVQKFSNLGAVKIPRVCFPLPVEERDRSTNIPVGYQEPFVTG